MASGPLVISGTSRPLMTSGRQTAGSLPPGWSKVPPAAYVAVNLPLAGLQRSAYRYMSGLQRSAYPYMSTTVSLPLHGLSGLLPLRNTRAVFLPLPRRAVFLPLRKTQAVFLPLPRRAVFLPLCKTQAVLLPLDARKSASARRP